MGKDRLEGKELEGREREREKVRWSCSWMKERGVREFLRSEPRLTMIDENNVRASSCIATRIVELATIFHPFYEWKQKEKGKDV
jgi:hypothetical protein